MDDEQTKEILLNRPIVCSKCKSALFYKGSGRYVCGECKNEEYDDFGKVKKFIDEHGVSNAATISEETGVSMRNINFMLREGRVEIPEGSAHYIRCLGCGCEIRYGRYCVDCIRKTTNDLKQAFFVGDLGEKPKNSGSMRFYNKEDDKNKKSK